jgi:hypothetical protein
LGGVGVTAIIIAAGRLNIRQTGAFQSLELIFYVFTILCFFILFLFNFQRLLDVPASPEVSRIVLSVIHNISSLQD